MTTVGGAGIVYALQMGCARETQVVESKARREPPPEWSPDDPGVDYRHWLRVEADGSVTAFTNRTEIGQGLTTALYNVLCQGMDLPEERINLVLGDTELCPEDGPTTGSATTQYVVWGFWRACPWIRRDLIRRAADRVGVAAEELQYRGGRIVGTKDSSIHIGIGELVDDALQIATIDPTETLAPERQYVDNATLNANGEAIVTGTLEYVGDLYPEGCLYGAKLRSERFPDVSRILEVDTSAASGIPDLVSIKVMRNKRVFAFGRTYSAARKGLAAVKTIWSEPNRPPELDNEREIRDGARLVSVLEEKGQVDGGFESAPRVLEESYITQYASQVPMETDSAVASFGREKTAIWVSTQNPLLMRYRTARKWKVPEEQVRVISRPAGGGFGAKAGHMVPTEAAIMSKAVRAPVKLIHSRAEEFNARGRYKESVIVDIASGVGADGRLQARRIDIFQDEGFGTVGVYDIPHVLTRLYQAPMPMRHATMRGTSYVQVCYALESHTDMVARAVGMDPLAFRQLNVSLPAFRSLLDECAEMIGWGAQGLPADHGRGIALCRHGGLQLGVVAAQVAVDRASGRLEVQSLCGAFDIGKIINIHNLSMGVKGAMLWGLGFALFEEVKLDGHRSYTRSLAEYRIPHFSDTPPIDIVFLDKAQPGAPRGCGELPVIPTVGALCNAVYDAVGVRFYDLPMTPQRVKQALAGTAST